MKMRYIYKCLKNYNHVSKQDLAGNGGGEERIVAVGDFHMSSNFDEYRWFMKDHRIGENKQLCK